MLAITYFPILLFRTALLWMEMKMLMTCFTYNFKLLSTARIWRFAFKCHVSNTHRSSEQNEQFSPFLFEHKSFLTDFTSAFSCLHFCYLTSFSFHFCLFLHLLSSLFFSPSMYDDFYYSVFFIMYSHCWCCIYHVSCSIYRHFQDTYCEFFKK